MSQGRPHPPMTITAFPWGSPKFQLLICPSSMPMAPPLARHRSGNTSSRS